MPLPPLRHAAWSTVAAIACMGAALTSWMGGSTGMMLGFLVLAVALALILAAGIRRHAGKASS